MPSARSVGLEMANTEQPGTPNVVFEYLLLLGRSTENANTPLSSEHSPTNGKTMQLTDQTLGTPPVLRTSTTLVGQSFYTVRLFLEAQAD